MDASSSKMGANMEQYIKLYIYIYGKIFSPENFFFYWYVHALDICSLYAENNGVFRVTFFCYRAETD